MRMLLKTFLLGFIALASGYQPSYPTSDNVCKLRIHPGIRCYGHSGNAGQKFGYVTDNRCRAYACPGKCKAFRYKGCGGNDNRFETMEMCEKSCKPKVIVEPPYEPPAGPEPPYEPPAPPSPETPYEPPAPPSPETPYEPPAPPAPETPYEPPAPPPPSPYEPPVDPPQPQPPYVPQTSPPYLKTTPAPPTCPDDDPKIIDLKKEKDRLEKKLQDTLGKLKKCEQPGGGDAGKKIKYGFSMDRGFSNGKCKPFEYFGCGGNQNRFSSKHICQKKCKGMRRYYRKQRRYRRYLPRRCKLPIDQGHCSVY